MTPKYQSMNEVKGLTWRKNRKASTENAVCPLMPLIRGIFEEKKIRW